MNTVIIINLNGNAFHLEEPGYVSLRTYLERAQAQLRDNPDKAEIMADLEQAIADKCAHFLLPHKNVLTAAEIDEVAARQMGACARSGNGATQRPVARHARHRLRPTAPREAAQRQREPRTARRCENRRRIGPSAQASVPNPPRRDVERRVHGVGGVFEHRRDDRANRLRAVHAAHLWDLDSGLRRDDAGRTVREYRRRVRRGGGNALQRTRSDRSRQETLRGIQGQQGMAASLAAAAPRMAPTMA